jgi:outer membrane protein insertion porin family
VKRCLGLFLFLSLGLAAPIEHIQIVGADPILEALARIALPFGVGDEPGNLEAARQAILATGYFENVQLSLQGTTLLVTLVPNPTIQEVRVEEEAFPSQPLLQNLEDQYAVGPGAIYNPRKAQEAATLLGQIFQQRGFPFLPQVTFSTKPLSSGVELIFHVEEHPPLHKVILAKTSFVPTSQLEPLFAPLAKLGHFSWKEYAQAVQQADLLYAEAGYRFSGVDPAGTQLQDGVLKVAFQELHIAAIQAPSGIETQLLGLGPGDPLNTRKLLDGINLLSKRLGRVVNFELQASAPGQVTVVLSLGGVNYGVIQKDEIVGNTALPTQELIKALRLQPGDPYNPLLAQQDFLRLEQIYQQAGYELVNQPDFSFQNGVYIQKIQEVRIGGYRLDWQGHHITQNIVVLRELPAPGSLFSVSALRDALSALLKTQLFAAPPTVDLAPGPQPDEVTVILGLKEANTLTFQPSIAYSTLSGWSGQLSVSDIDLFGLNQIVSASLAFVQNNAHDNLSASLSYQIPWLYVPFADFERVPTSVGFSFFTTPVDNNTLYAPSGANTHWVYTDRNTGVSLSVNRPFSAHLPALQLGTTLSWELVIPKLDIYAPPSCAGTTCPSQSQAEALLPPPYQVYQLQLSGTYVQVNDVNFPTHGYKAIAQVATGLSLPQGEPSQVYAPLSMTGKTYFPLGNDNRQAVVIQASVGTILGNPPPTSDFQLGGNASDLSLLRGYSPGFLVGTHLLLGNLEYRYNFDLSQFGGTGLYGIVFADLGSAWGAPSTPNLVFYGDAGVGIRLQLNLFGALFPPLELDYGFSQRNPTGVLSFSIVPPI